MENDSNNERIEAPSPEEPMDRRGFLGLVTNWSAAVVLGVIAGVTLLDTKEAPAAAAGWVNSRGGGGGAAGWVNRGGGGGTAGWVNRGGGGGGGGWVNSRGGGGAWANGRGGGGGAWANRR